MVNIAKGFIQKFLSKDSRTRMVEKNVIGNFLIKGISIILSLIIIPMTLGYVSEYNYGIWISLSSVIGWLTYFDIGVNNGLRNKLTEAISNRDYKLAQKYVSTTYAILILIFGGLFFLFLAIYKFIDWYGFFSLSPAEVKLLPLIILIISGFICLRSVLSTVLIVLFAFQRSAMSAFIAMLEQVVIVVTIFFLVRLTEGSLLNLCIAYCGGPILVLLAASVVMYHKKYRSIRPKISAVDFRLKGKLFNLGLRFFVIQIAGLVQFQTVNYIILKFFGPIDVTAYNITYKYFNVLYMIWGLMLAPIWSAVTEAKALNDLSWIKRTVSKYQRLFFAFLLLGLVMLVFSPWIYKIWLGNRIQTIPFDLSFVVFLYSITLMWGSLYVQILNGLGALRVQFIASVISPIVFIGICFLLINVFHLGVVSIVIASIIANFNGIVLAPYQYYLVVNNRKSGSLWATLD